jgi:four helix bundle protein
MCSGMTQAAREDFKTRAFRLARTVFHLYPRLATGGPHYKHLAHQLLRSATAVGALLEEGAVANSRRDMGAKYAIALREAREANYWSRLGETEAKWKPELSDITQETGEFVAMLTVAVKKLRAS